jgi:ubiquinone/menaquinone biosynthesis C-methylase UbiE
MRMRKELAWELSFNYEKETLEEIARKRGLSHNLSGKGEIVKWLLDNGLTWKDYVFTIDPYMATRIKVCRFFGIRKGLKVLDIGAGPGATSFAAASLMKNQGRILAIEYLEYFVKQGKRKAKWNGMDDVVEFRQGDINNIDLGEELFDIALLVFTPQYVGDMEELEAILLKLRKVAKRVGIADYHPVPRNFAQSVFLLKNWYNSDRGRAIKNESRNINRLFHPDEIKQALENTGWRKFSEKTIHASPKHILTHKAWKHNTENFDKWQEKITDPIAKEISLSRFKTLDSLFKNGVLPAQLDTYAILAEAT